MINFTFAVWTTFSSLNASSVAYHKVEYHNIIESPEGAPPHIALAEIFVARRLLDEQFHLLLNRDSLVDVREVASGEFVADSVDDG